MKSRILLMILILLPALAWSQDDLMAILEEQGAQEDQEVFGTFKATRIINGHSVETRSKGELDFLISHRFGPIDTGVENFWGLDGAQIRLGLSYGISDNITVGLGRSSFNQVYDFYGKWKVIPQSNKSPVSMAVFGSFARRTDEFFEIVVRNAGEGLESSKRNAYTAQLLIARKFTSALSLQITPTLVNRSFSEYPGEPDNLLAIGLGGRYKITRRVSINAETYPTLNSGPETGDAFAIGVDLETGGHVFQLHLTNAQQINERGFVGETTGHFFKGDIHFGFNISRVFDLTPGR